MLDQVAVLKPRQCPRSLDLSSETLKPLLAYQLTEAACFFYTNIHSSLICSFVLVGLDESCPTYIIFE